MHALQPPESCPWPGGKVHYTGVRTPRSDAVSNFFRWQWMWRSRPRLIGIALGAMAFGAALILFAVLAPGPIDKGKGLTICGGVMFAALGGYQLLQGMFSPAGAFGDHDAPEPARRIRRRSACRG